MYKEWFEGTWGYRWGLPLASNQLKNDAHDLIPCMMQESALLIFILLDKEFIKNVLYLSYFILTSQIVKMFQNLKSFLYI